MSIKTGPDARPACGERYQIHSAPAAHDLRFAVQSSGAGSPIRALGAAALATLLASTCCLAPLALLMVGLTGSWMVHLTALSRWQPLFLAVAVVAMALAGRRVWSRQACLDGRICATPRVLRAYRVLYVLVAALLLLNLAVPLIAPWFYD